MTDEEDERLLRVEGQTRALALAFAQTVDALVGDAQDIRDRIAAAVGRGVPEASDASLAWAMEPAMTSLRQSLTGAASPPRPAGAAPQGGPEAADGDAAAATSVAEPAARDDAVCER